MCQTGQTILMPVLKAPGGISLKRLERPVLVVQLPVSSECVCVCVYKWVSLIWSISDRKDDHSTHIQYTLTFLVRAHIH